MSNFQQRVMDLVRDYWPGIGEDRVERGRRLLEETLELAQAVGVSREQALGHVERAYSRPPGAVDQELGQVVLCTAALAEVEGFDVRMRGEIELERLSAPGMKDKMRARHAAKVADGMAGAIDEA